MDQLSNNQTDLYFFQQCLVWSLQDAAGYQTYGEPAVYVPPYTASHNGDLSFACAFVRQAMNYAEENAGRFKGYAKVLDNRYTQQCAVFSGGRTALGGKSGDPQSVCPAGTYRRKCRLLSGRGGVYPL